MILKRHIQKRRIEGGESRQIKANQGKSRQIKANHLAVKLLMVIMTNLCLSCDIIDSISYNLDRDFVVVDDTSETDKIDTIAPDTGSDEIVQDNDLPADTSISGQSTQSENPQNSSTSVTAAPDTGSDEIGQDNDLPADSTISGQSTLSENPQNSSAAEDTPRPEAEGGSKTGSTNVFTIRAKESADIKLADLAEKIGSEPIEITEEKVAVLSEDQSEVNVALFMIESEQEPFVKKWKDLKDADGNPLVNFAEIKKSIYAQLENSTASETSSIMNGTITINMSAGFQVDEDENGETIEEIANSVYFVKKKAINDLKVYFNNKCGDKVIQKSELFRVFNVDQSDINEFDDEDDAEAEEMSNDAAVDEMNSSVAVDGEISSDDFVLEDETIDELASNVLGSPCLSAVLLNLALSEKFEDMDALADNNKISLETDSVKAIIRFIHEDIGEGIENVSNVPQPILTDVVANKVTRNVSLYKILGKKIQKPRPPIYDPKPYPVTGGQTLLRPVDIPPAITPEQPVVVVPEPVVVVPEPVVVVYEPAAEPEPVVEESVSLQNQVPKEPEKTGADTGDPKLDKWLNGIPNGAILVKSNKKRGDWKQDFGPGAVKFIEWLESGKGEYNHAGLFDRTRFKNRGYKIDARCVLSINPKKSEVQTLDSFINSKHGIYYPYKWSEKKAKEAVNYVNEKFKFGGSDISEEIEKEKYQGKIKYLNVGELLLDLTWSSDYCHQQSYHKRSICTRVPYRAWKRVDINIDAGKDYTLINPAGELGNLITPDELMYSTSDQVADIEVEAFGVTLYHDHVKLFKKTTKRYSKKP